MSNTARDQAVAQVASIVSLVKALGVDFERLEELREKFDDWAERGTDDLSLTFGTEAEWRAAWAAESPSEAEELADLEEAAGDCTDHEDAQQRIQEDALSVEVRSGWASPSEALTPDEFRIVLCTGGPHVELVGDLDQYAEPGRVRVLFRDWGESGELHDFDRDAVLTYCRQFYFGA